MNYKGNTAYTALVKAGVRRKQPGIQKLIKYNLGQLPNEAYNYIN
jgi:hypothetical protein